MKNSLNEIYLSRKMKLVLRTQVTDTILPQNVLSTLQRNIQDLGFILDDEIIQILSTWTMKELTPFYTWLVQELKVLVGANVIHKPMYPNFPQQVMEMDESELYMNAIVHYLHNYLLDECWLPSTEIKERMFLTDNNIKLKVISLGSIEDFRGMVNNMLSSKVTLSQQDFDDLDTYYSEVKFVNLPKTIPNKENKIFILRKMYSMGTGELNASIIAQHINTTTDLLRFIVSLSDGDISLVEYPKFRNFKRSERRFLISLLNNVANAEEMNKYRNLWLRVGEKLHVGDYKKQYPKSFNEFQKLRNDKIRGFNSKVEFCIKNNNIEMAVDLLKTRPSLFARRLNELLSKSNGEYRYIIESFNKVASQVETTVLLQVYGFFKNRDTANDRIFMPKGKMAKAQIIPNKMNHLEDFICNTVCYACLDAITKKHKDKNNVGKYFVSEDLKDFPVPHMLRSQSKGFKPYVKGTRIEMKKDSEFLRFFVYWKGNSVDIDLSAGMYDENFNFKNHIGFTNLESSGCYHSGDITSAPNGASEFIDIDIKALKNKNIRYVLMDLRSFSHHQFSEIEDSFVGWMSRQNINDGKIYEAKTVENKFELDGETRSSTPVIFDLEENKVIYLDLSFCVGSGSSLSASGSKIIKTIKSFIDNERANLFDLFNSSFRGRGIRTLNKYDADFVIDINDGDVTPFDQEKILGEYLV